MTDDATERERLSRRADVERDRLLRIFDALVGRHPVAHAEHRAKQIAIPLAIVAVAGTTVGVALVQRKRKHEPRARTRDRRMPAHLEIARGVLVSVATFMLAAIAKKYLARLITQRR